MSDIEKLREWVRDSDLMKEILESTLEEKVSRQLKGKKYNIYDIMYEVLEVVLPDLTIESEKIIEYCCFGTGLSQLDIILDLQRENIEALRSYSDLVYYTYYETIDHYGLEDLLSEHVNK